MVDVFKVPPVDYTSRTFESLRDDALRLIPFFTPEWTDHNPTDKGIVLLELFAYIADGLHFYGDRMVGEGTLATCITRTSTLNHLKLLGYVPPGAAPATVTLKFTVASTLTASDEVIIPALTKVTTSQTTSNLAVPFETDVDLIIPVGKTTGTVTATQGVTRGSAAPNGEALGTSSGEALQEFKLNHDPAILSTIRVFVDEGGVGSYTEYTRKATFVGESSNARVFVVVVADDNTTVVQFGDGINGKIPPANATIQAAYRTGGGSAGNVGVGAISKISSSLGFSASVTNTVSAAGGVSAPTLAELKTLGPQSLETFNRAVTLNDFANFAKTVPGVATAAAEFSLVGSVVTVYAADSSGNTTTALKASVKSTLEPVAVLGVTVETGDPVQVPIDIEGDVVVKSSVSRTKVSAEIESLISNFFTVGSVEGQAALDVDVRLSDVLALLDNIDGVDYVELTKLTRQPTFDITDWTATTSQSFTSPSSFTANLLQASVSSTNTVEQEITVTLPDVLPAQPQEGDSVEATVVGSVTGTEAIPMVIRYLSDDGASLSEPYTLEGAPVTLTLTLPSAAAINGSTALPPTEGDELKVRVGKFRDSQTIRPLELRTRGTIDLNVTGGAA